MSDKTPKHRSKFFRVAVEGDTVDGRTIERQWIADMAASYNPDTYGARVWMEHIRGVMPDGPFGAYGDVVALKAEEANIDGQKRLALYAQIEPTGALINMVNSLKQKIYTSIEVATKFAGTGKAYLMGLAVTDTPASLGTERLAFTAQHPEASGLTARKHAPENLFSAASEALIEFEDVAADPEPGAFEKLMGQIGAFLNRSNPPAAPAPAPAPVAPTAPVDIPPPAFNAELLRDVLTRMAGHMSAQEQRLTQLGQEAALLRERVEQTADPNHSARPKVTGDTPTLADC